MTRELEVELERLTDEENRTEASEVRNDKLRSIARENGWDEDAFVEEMRKVEPELKALRLDRIAKVKDALLKEAQEKAEREKRVMERFITGAKAKPRPLLAQTVLWVPTTHIPGSDGRTYIRQVYAAIVIALPEDMSGVFDVTLRVLNPDGADFQVEAGYSQKWASGTWHFSEVDGGREWEHTPAKLKLSEEAKRNAARDIRAEEPIPIPIAQQLQDIGTLATKQALGPYTVESDARCALELIKRLSESLVRYLAS